MFPPRSTHAPCSECASSQRTGYPRHLLPARKRRISTRDEVPRFVRECVTAVVKRKQQFVISSRFRAELLRWRDNSRGERKHAASQQHSWTYGPAAGTVPMGTPRQARAPRAAQSRSRRVGGGACIQACRRPTNRACAVAGATAARDGCGPVRGGQSRHLPVRDTAMRRQPGAATHLYRGQANRRRSVRSTGRPRTVLTLYCPRTPAHGTGPFPWGSRRIPEFTSHTWMTYARALASRPRPHSPRGNPPVAPPR